MDVQSQIRMKLQVLKDDLGNLSLLEEAEAYRNEGYMGLFLVDSSQIAEERPLVWRKREK